MAHLHGRASALALKLALVALADLKDWSEIEALSERVVSALRGDEGLSRFDRERIARWPRRWASLRKEIRAFYVLALSDPDLQDCEGAALYRGLMAVLDGREPGDWPRQRLQMIYRHLYQQDAELELCPTRF